MDTLFALNPGAFAQLATHISIYNQPMSEGYRSMVTDALRDTVRLWRWQKYTLWNVPGMGAMLGKVAPVDVHGFFVVLDEQELELPSRESTFSTLRYTILTAGQRRKEGGRRLYEFGTMNFALAAAAIVGTTWMKKGRTRFAFFDRRPFWSIASAFAVSIVTIAGVRLGFKMLGVGTWVAEKSHGRALHQVTCVDCLDELVAFTDDQIRDMQNAKLPDPKPGQPPPPPEMEVKFKESMVANGALLKKDQKAMLLHQRRLLEQAGVPVAHMHEDRQTAKLRRLGMLTDDALKLPKDVSKAAGKSGSTPADVIAAADAAMEKLREQKHNGSLVERQVPSTCLCSVHDGLRSDASGFVHPLGWPIYPKDRELAARRNSAVEGWLVASQSPHH
jgi:hypothetical protein